MFQCFYFHGWLFSLLESQLSNRYLCISTPCYLNEVCLFLLIHHFIAANHNDFNSLIFSSDTTKISANNAALTSKSAHSASTLSQMSKSGNIGDKQLNTKGSANSGISIGKKTMVIEELNTSISVTKNLQSRDNRSSGTSSSKSAGKFDSMDESSNPSVDWERSQSLAGGLNNMVLNVKSAYANYISGIGKTSNPQYKHDKWMLPDKAVDTLTQLNLAIVSLRITTNSLMNYSEASF